MSTDAQNDPGFPEHQGINMNTDMMSMAFHALEKARADSKSMVDEVTAAANSARDGIDDAVVKLEAVSQGLASNLLSGVVQAGQQLEDLAARHQSEFDQAATKMLADAQAVIDHKIREAAVTASTAATGQINEDLKNVTDRFVGDVGRVCREADVTIADIGKIIADDRQAVKGTPTAVVVLIAVSSSVVSALLAVIAFKMIGG